MVSSNMILKLLVDKRAQKVLYAEATKELVDLLFHILSLPLSTLIELPDSKQNMGCLGKLKESVESTLHQTYRQPDNKHSASKKLFMCSYKSGSIPFDGHGFCGLKHVSDHQDARCPHCGRLMKVPMTFVRWPSNDKAVVKESTVTYMVMDYDLVIKPLSTITSINLMNNCGVKDLSQLEEISLPFGKDKALELVKASLMTDQVLTTLFRLTKEA